jgi:peptide/nickel transport system substrate-binding protein
MRLVLASLLFMTVPASGGEVGHRGGRLVTVLRSEPRTLNPVTAADGASRDLLGRMMADLVHVDRASLVPRPALAESWTASNGGRRYTLTLRRGLRFSDGHPCDAEDVVFSIETYLDPASRSPQRDVLVVGGEPVKVHATDARTVVFDLKEPFGPGERLFDGVAVLPRHLLSAARKAGGIPQAWGVGTPPAEIVGLGPFRLKQYVPGERAVLERNPYYWKTDAAGTALPYLDEIVFLFTPSEDAQVLRFQAGEADVVHRISADSFAALEKEQAARGYRLLDIGPGLEYTFLVFNLNEVDPKRLPDLAARQRWFQTLAFRRAVSLAIDRGALARLAYRGRATPLGGHVPPGNRLWVNRSLPPPRRDLEAARRLLAEAGFRRASEDDLLRDADGRSVELTIATSSGNASRAQMATLIQEDLRQLGMRVQVVSLENRSLLARVLDTRDYDTALLSLGTADGDPAGEMNVLTSAGATHVWRLGGAPATPWEQEIDRLMQSQIATASQTERKALYDRVQQLVVDNLPFVPLVSPNVLVGARNGLGNFQPVILDHPTLWNADELYWKQ